MPQIQSGETFSIGQQFTAARANNHVNGATILPGIITEQNAVTANDIQSVDQIVVYDNSANALKKASINDVLNANLTGTFSDIVTSDLSAKPGQDVLITPNSSTVVNSLAYTTIVSGSVTTVTLTYNSHGFSEGSFVSITNATLSAINGTRRIVSTSVNSFVFYVYESTAGGFGTLSCQKLATSRNEGNLNTNGNFHVVNSATVEGNLRVLGTGKFHGTSAITIPSGTTAERPSIVESGQFRLNTTDSTIEIYNGTEWIDNFGSNIYVKSGQGGAQTAGTWNTCYETPVLTTIPSDETWIYEFTVSVTGGYTNGNTRPDWYSVLFRAYKNETLLVEQPAATGAYGFHNTTFTFHTEMTFADNNKKLVFQTYNTWGLFDTPRYKIKLTKVKTYTLSNKNLCV